MDYDKFCRWCRENASRPEVGWFGRHIRANDELLHYVEVGSGPPLIFVHGFMEWSYTWNANLPALGEHARVLALDLRGYGLSVRNPRLGHSLDDQVEVLRSFMDALDLEQAVLCGHSMGGEISLRFALQSPERVRALVLVASTGYVERKQRPLQQALLRAPGVGRLLLRAAMMNRRFAEKALREVYKDPRQITPGDVTAYLLPARAPGTAASLVRIMCEMDFGRHGHRLRDVTTPSLLIWGADDPVVPPEQGRRLAADLAGSRLVVFPDCGHLPHAEHPDLFNRTVAEFLAGLDEQKPAP